MFRLLLGAGLGILGLKAVEKLRKDKDYNEKYEKIMKNIKDLMSDISSISTETANKKISEMNNFLIQEIETEILNLNVESKKDILDKLEKLKSEDETSIKVLSSIVVLYVESMKKNVETKFEDSNGSEDNSSVKEEKAKPKTKPKE